MNSVHIRMALASIAALLALGCEASSGPVFDAGSGGERVDSGVEDRDASTRADAGPGGGERDGGGGTMSPRTPWSMGTTYILSGHSLTDTVISQPWPGRLTEAVMRDPAGDYSQLKKATIPGSFISWRWNNPESGGDQAAQWPEDMGRYEGLIITTAVPLQADDAVRQTDQVEWLKMAVDHAWANGAGGAGAPTLLYTTWAHLAPEPTVPHPEDGRSFRERLDLDEPRWEAMQDFVNDDRPAGQAPLYLIPGHRLMMRIADDIEAGTAPFGAIGDIFADNIHPNDIGAYALTLLHYACIYGRDPAAYLPDRLVDQDTLSAAQAAYFKRIVPEVVTGYARTGLTSLTGDP